MNYRSSDLLSLSEYDIWSLPKGTHQIIFNDAVIEVTNKQIAISWYYWEFYRTFPNIAPMVSTDIVPITFNTGSHRKLCETILWHIYDHYRFPPAGIVWDLSRCFLRINNNVYNMICTRLSSYVTSASLHDLIEILQEPTVVAAKQDYISTVTEANYDENVVSHAINDTHRVVSNLLYKNPGKLHHNGIKKLTMAGIVNRGQILQLIGPRGYVQDIDAEVFPLPIDVGYGEGLNTTYDSATESRGASRSIMMTNEPLQQSEWFNREVQLLMSCIHSVSDCGCTGYVTVPFLVQITDLTLLKGKYHMVDGEPILIWDSIDHLIGTVIEMRSITGCGNTDTQSVCKICLGWVYNIIPPGTNVGYALATALCAMISQRIMSTKHYEGSSSSKMLELPKTALPYITINHRHKSKIFLTEQATQHTILVRIDIKFITHLSQINQIDVSELSPARMSNITEVGMVYLDSAGNPTGPFEVMTLRVSGVGVYLTAEVLNHLKKNGWTTSKNYIEFQLANWKINKPIFGIPRKGDNIYLFLNDVRNFIKPKTAGDVKITNYRTRAKALSEFIQVLRTRLEGNINMSQVEIFIRGCMVVNLAERDYRLPHPSCQTWEFASLKVLLLHRSFAGMLAYQEQLGALIDPHWYNDDNKTSHLLDDIVAGD